MGDHRAAEAEAIGDVRDRVELISGRITGRTAGRLQRERDHRITGDAMW
jgi:hypothetical protein